MLWEYLASNWIYYLFLFLCHTVLCIPQIIAFIMVFIITFVLISKKITDP